MSIGGANAGSLPASLAGTGAAALPADAEQLHSSPASQVKPSPQSASFWQGSS
jgi:hypothetical protein